jgi:hypothetical protein
MTRGMLASGATAVRSDPTLKFKFGIVDCTTDKADPATKIV